MTVGSGDRVDRRPEGRWSDLSIGIVLVLTAGVAHFWYFREMGLYEDDFTHIGFGMARSWTTALDAILWALRTWPQGRPLHFSAPPLLTFIAMQSGGLSTLYLMGWAVLSLNVVLFYLFLRRVGVPIFALVGALVFVLFPPDTTHPFLTHAIAIQPSLTFLILAMFLYLSRWRWLSYFVILGALWMYESTFLPFLVVPLLAVPRGKHKAREMLVHVVICGAIIAGTFVVRRVLGDERVEDLPSLIRLVAYTAGGMFVGPLTSIYLSAFRVGTALRGMDATLALVALAFGTIFFVLMRRLPVRPFPTVYGLEPVYQWGELTCTIGKRWSERLAISGALLPSAGILMIVVAYGFSFFHFPPVFTQGRLTSVHIAAAVGAAFLFGWIATVIVSAFGTRWRVLATAGVALVLASWVIYGLLIQQDMRATWQQQKLYWSQVLPLVKDATDDTLVLVMQAGEPPSKFIYSQSFADSLVLDKIFALSGREEQRRTRLFYVAPGWTKSLVRDGDKLLVNVRTKGDYYEATEDLASKQIILLERQGDVVTRHEGTQMVQGIELKIKPRVSDATAQIANQPLYQLLSIK